VRRVYNYASLSFWRVSKKNYNSIENNKLNIHFIKKCVKENIAFLIKFISSREILQSLKMLVKLSDFTYDPRKVNRNKATNIIIKMHNF